MPVAAALAALIEGGNAPDAILMPATYDGRDVAGRLSAKLDRPVLTNVTGLVESDGGLSSQHPVFGGSHIVTARFTGEGPGIFVIRAKSFAAEPSGGAAAAVVAAPVPDDVAATNTAKIVERHVEERSGPKLDEAAVVVSGGRGLGDAANYALIEELAKLLHGAAGASRAIVDAGWVPYSHQVGQTGKTVKPTVYMACGISGATQHLVGMKGSKNIVAINKDQEAPDLLGGRPRDRGRRAQGAAGTDRGAQGQGLNAAAGALDPTLSARQGTGVWAPCRSNSRPGRGSDAAPARASHVHRRAGAPAVHSAQSADRT